MFYSINFYEAVAINIEDCLLCTFVSRSALKTTISRQLKFVPVWKGL